MVKRLIAYSLVLLFAAAACQQKIATPFTTNTPQTPAIITQAIEAAVTPTGTSQPTSIVPTPSQTPTSPPVPTSTFTVTPTPQALTQESQAIVVDHTSVQLFDQIPDEYLTRARDLRMMYADASVGQNINEALNCLTAPNWASSPSPCRNDYIDQKWNWKTFTGVDYEAGKVPNRILFTPDPNKYNRDNWIFEGLPGGWTDITRNFIESLAPSYLDKADVLSYQFNYFHVSENSNITDPEKGFFVAQPSNYDYKDLEDFIAQHPDKIFIYWTTSLARNIGTQISVDFNNQMRQYALDNNLVLFDVADIESHTDLGEPCYDNRDGVEYCSRRADGSTIKCENELDDKVQIPAICQDYTTEPDAGHLGSVSSGGLRLAKAFWVLMARIAGWQP